MNANDRVALVIGKLTIRNAEIEAQLETQAATIAAQTEELKKLKEEKPKDNAAD